MTTLHNHDNHFDENLREIGRRSAVPMGASADVRNRCMDTLAEGNAAKIGRLRRPAILSMLSMAACIALACGLFFPWGGGRTAQAAIILAKLNEQIQNSRLIDITLNNLVIEDVSIDGNVQLSDLGFAGDIDISVKDDEGDVNVDVAFGLSEKEGWVLIRDLEIPDKDAQVLLSMFLFPGTETLILLPEDALQGEKFGGHIDDVLKELSSGEATQLLSAIIESHVKVGATVTDQPDGTVLLQIPFDDEEAIGALMEVVLDAGITADLRDNLVSEEVDIEDLKLELRTEMADDDDLQALIGSQLTVVYDPSKEQVRSFSLDNIGTEYGSISVAIGQGTPDPTMLDSSRVITATTRTLDFNALESLFGGASRRH